MFEELFDEDQPEYVSANIQYSSGKSCASTLDLPPLPRQESQFVGLKNQYHSL